MPAPAALTEYQLERRFWQEFGAPQPPLDDWPRLKIAQYVCIQRAFDEVEVDRNRAANNSGLPSGTGTARPPASPHVTEEAYQAMRAKAQPPPMPPGAPPPT